MRAGRSRFVPHVSAARFSSPRDTVKPSSLPCASFRITDVVLEGNADWRPRRWGENYRDLCPFFRNATYKDASVRYAIAWAFPLLETHHFVDGCTYPGFASLDPDRIRSLVRQGSCKSITISDGSHHSFCGLGNEVDLQLHPKLLLQPCKYDCQGRCAVGAKESLIAAINQSE